LGKTWNPPKPPNGGVQGRLKKKEKKSEKNLKIPRTQSDPRSERKQKKSQCYEEVLFVDLVESKKELLRNGVLFV